MKFQLILKKRLKLPNTDEGIDLIAETFDNQYWAIQCKYRSDKTETLKVKGDLATFNNLAFTVCKNYFSWNYCCNS
jgi:predicted helicase